MKYRIESENRTRIRIRLFTGKLSPEQAEILEYAFSAMEGVDRVTVYRETGGCALFFHCPKEEIIKRLDAFRFENVQMMAREELTRISASEMKNRKLDPALKRRLRMHILAETVFDIAMPMPLQVGYHIYQMITLKQV